MCTPIYHILILKWISILLGIRDLNDNNRMLALVLTAEVGTTSVQMIQPKDSATFKEGTETLAGTQY